MYNAVKYQTEAMTRLKKIKYCVNVFHFSTYVMAVLYKSVIFFYFLIINCFIACYFYDLNFL